MLNEQPFMADLFEMPTAADVGLLCTNVRTLDGRRPVFVDQIESVFLFPYLNMRFLEIKPGSDGAPRPRAGVEADPAPEPAVADEDQEIDEDFLRRIREA
jgi:hypothetical protein